VRGAPSNGSSYRDKTDPTVADSFQAVGGGLKAAETTALMPFALGGQLPVRVAGHVHALTTIKTGA